MTDPTRIPGVLDALRRTWEGQPELPLSTLFGMLENRGIGWGTDDGELLRVLGELERVHPARLPMREARPAGRYLITTQGPEHRVTVDPHRVIVRRIMPDRRAAQPGVWDYRAIRPTGPATPLVITDAGGIEHRLGVVRHITLLDAAPAPEVTDLGGLRRREVGEAVHLIRLAGGDLALLDHGLELFRRGRRSLERESLRWEEVGTCRPGGELSVRLRGGGGVVSLGAVEQILVVEDVPAD